MTQPPANSISAANPLPAFKAVLWDMDGTLVLSEPLHTKCIQAIGDEMGMPVSPDLCMRAQGISHRHAYDTITKELGEMPLAFDAWVTRASQLYMEFVADITPRDNVIDIIRALHERGIKQAIFSNNPRRFIDATVKSFSRFFDQPFDVFPLIISLDDVPAKPAPDGYLLAAQQMGVTPDQCLVMEDSPTGAAAGKAAGCFTIYWPQENEQRALKVGPDLITANLDFFL